MATNGFVVDGVAGATMLVDVLTNPLDLLTQYDLPLVRVQPVHMIQKMKENLIASALPFKAVHLEGSAATACVCTTHQVAPFVSL